MNKKNIIILVNFLLILGLSGCGLSPYKAPTGKEPYALLKLKYSYNEITSGTTLGSRLQIRQGKDLKNQDFQVAHNKSYGTVKKDEVKPKIPVEALRIHPDKNTDARMAVFFFWYTTQTYTTYVNGVPMIQAQQVYHENNCTVDINFEPKAGKEYLLDYTATSVNKGCTAQAYEKLKLKNGKFKLKPVGTSKEA